VVTHPEKVRYLLHLSKDGSDEPDVEPAAVYEEAGHGERHVPLDQVLFLGDGASDMPAFRLMNESNGIGIGIFHEDSADEWRGQDDTNPGRRVQNLAPADYSEGSELMQSLLLSVESIGKRIALRKLGRGE
jgi:trehalose-6-phosphatase